MDEIQGERPRIPGDRNAIWMDNVSMVEPQAVSSNTTMDARESLESQLVGRRYPPHGEDEEGNRRSGGNSDQHADKFGCRGQPGQDNEASFSTIQLCGSQFRPDMPANVHPKGQIGQGIAHDQAPNEGENGHTQTSITIGRRTPRHRKVQFSDFGFTTAADGRSREGGQAQRPKAQRTNKTSQGMGLQHRQDPRGASDSSACPGRNTRSGAADNSRIGRRPRRESVLQVAGRLKPESMGRPAVQVRSKLRGRSGDSSSELEAKRRKVAHHPQGSQSISQRCPRNAATATSWLPSSTAVRRDEHCTGMDKGIEEARLERGNPAAISAIESEENFCPGNTSGWCDEQTCRLVVQKRRCSQLQVGPEDIPESLQCVQVPATGGFICQQGEQAMSSLLQLEARPAITGQCLGPTLGASGAHLGEPPLGADQPLLGEDTSGSRPLLGMPTLLAIQPVVAQTAITTEGSNVGDQKANVQRSKRDPDALSTLVNPFHGAGRLTIQGVRHACRQVERLHDVPLRQRLQWLEGVAYVANPLEKLAIKQAIKRVKAQGGQPKYPIFYDIRKIVQFAFNQPVDGHNAVPWDPSTEPLELLLDKLLLQLRLTTMMRSADVANIHWALFQHDQMFFLRTTDKSAAARDISVKGMTLDYLIEYLHRHRDHPGQFLFRYVKKPDHCLSAQRLAKRALERLAACGINTEIFKSHSLRGATATHLLQQGAPRSLVKSRGGWSSSTTLDRYYSRLHQHQNWEAILLNASGGHVEVRQSCSCFALQSNASGAFPTQEGKSPEAETRREKQLEDLHARGIWRLMYSRMVCPSCGGKLATEAAFLCPVCESLFHVRCLATAPSTGHPEPRFLPSCFLCHAWQQRVNASPASDQDV